VDPHADPSHVAQTLTALLVPTKSRRLTIDAEGWADQDELRTVAAQLIGGDFSEKTWKSALDRFQGRRFEVANGRIRLRGRRSIRRGPRLHVPDILYHATTRKNLEKYLRKEALIGGSARKVFFSTEEAQAWRAAHRLRGEPVVLYVDAGRARRVSQVRFRRNPQNGLFEAPKVPLQHVLNLQDGFAPQLSAGGLPVRRGEHGGIEVALAQVARRSGITWEVAKGKLEPGESPEACAIREVQEEMGVSVDFELVRYVGLVRYGFLAPGSKPRLKSVYLYLMNPQGPMDSFSPSTREGIRRVQWFSAEEAASAVSHTSLQPIMRRARDLLAKHELSRELLPVPCA